MRKEEEFVKGLFKDAGYKVFHGEGYDFDAEKGDLKLAIEVKLTDVSKPEGKIVIPWSQVDALMRAAKNGKKSYLFLILYGGEKDKNVAIFGLVDCWAFSYVTGEEIVIAQPSESPFVLSKDE